MGVVALQLAGPLQSWGSQSRFVRRETESAPTKSGIIGLIAAAQGRRRSDPIEDLVGLRLGVRVDQPGQLVRDFQTAIRRERRRDGGVDIRPMPLSYRFYLGDAVYLAALEGPVGVVRGIDEALRNPAFPLFLGRRSCPPARPVSRGWQEINLAAVLSDTPWLAGPHEQRRRRHEPAVVLETIMDADPEDRIVETFHDDPVSFDPNRRIYRWRRVIRGTVTVPNPLGLVAAAPVRHDPMAALGG